MKTPDGPASDGPKPASDRVAAHNAAVLDALPFGDTQDFADAARGFLGTIEDAHILGDRGRVVWTLKTFRFLDSETAPPTVNPSLWRQARLNMAHGLFEVVPGVYQVRGFDIANMTLIEGTRGVIVVDALTSIESAREAIALYRRHRGERPVTGVVYTHTHVDHWGGALGVVTAEDVQKGGVPIIAPDEFMEHAVSENVIAGNAMIRRGLYQFGGMLPRGPSQLVDCGLGKAITAGRVALLAPTDLITKTGETRDDRRGRVRVPDGARYRSAGRDAFLSARVQGPEPRRKRDAQLPQPAAVPRRPGAQFARLVEVHPRSARSMGRRGRSRCADSTIGRCGAASASPLTSKRSAISIATPTTRPYA